MEDVGRRGFTASHELCLAVARATVRKPSNGGATIALQVGEHLADKLAEELAGMLKEVLPAAITDSIAGDLLQGADEVAGFTGIDRRAVYHLAQTRKLPVFRMGTVICARKSTLMRWIEEQEAKSMGAAA